MVARETVIGMRVHVDSDNEEWGRVVGDGVIEDISAAGSCLVQMQDGARQRIWITEEDLWLKTS